MNIKYLFGLAILFFVVLILIFLRAPIGLMSMRSNPPTNASNNNNANTPLSLIVEPDVGIAPVLAMINSASKSVDLVMYELQDKQVEAALAADEARGVAVRVLLSVGYEGGESSSNQAAYDFLIAGGVPVRWSPSYFALTHEKSLVADGNEALIMTFNFTAQYYSTSRDFGIVDRDQKDVGAIENTFDADWRGADDEGGEEDDGADSLSGASVAGNNGDRGDDLVWSPGSERAMLTIINSAKKSLDIYNEEMADPAVTAALISAAQRGVMVSVVMTNDGEWNSEFEELATAGADVRSYGESAPLYIHAKMIIADGTRAFVGSENFSKGSLGDNRELGIVISAPAIIVLLMHIFADDQKNAAKFSD